MEQIHLKLTQLHQNKIRMIIQIDESLFKAQIRPCDMNQACLLEPFSLRQMQDIIAEYQINKCLSFQAPKWLNIRIARLNPSQKGIFITIELVNLSTAQEQPVSGISQQIVKEVASIRQEFHSLQSYHTKTQDLNRQYKSHHNQIELLSAKIKELQLQLEDAQQKMDFIYHYFKRRIGYLEQNKANNSTQQQNAQ